MSSSSEEDPEDIIRLQQIQEATSEHLQAALKKREPAKEEKPDPLLTSTSRKANQTQVEEHFGLKTTPEFRSHVARKLISHLDRLIETVETEKEFPPQIVEGGIRLLSSSRSFVTEDSSEQLPIKRKSEIACCIDSTSSSSDEDRQDLASVCISGEEVLNSGEGVFKKNSPKFSCLVGDKSHSSTKTKKLKKHREKSEVFT